MTAIKYKDGGTWHTLTMPSAVHIGASSPDQNVKQIWVDTDELTVPSYYIPPLVSVLPTAPFDGQEVRYLADATNGVVWTLRYRAASLSAYKWEFVGGADMLSGVPGNYATTQTTVAWENPAAGPILTTPLAGVYDVRAGFEGWQSVATPRANQAGVSVAGAADPQADPINPNWASLYSASGLPASTAWEFRTTGLASGAVLRFYYWRDANAIYTFRQRYLRLKPVRVS